MPPKTKRYSHYINKNVIDPDGPNTALCGFQVSEIPPVTTRDLCPDCKRIFEHVFAVSERDPTPAEELIVEYLKQSEPIALEATVVEVVGDIPVMLGQFKIGTATVYEDKSMMVRFEEAYVRDELYEGVINGAPMALTVQTVG